MGGNMKCFKSCFIISFLLFVFLCVAGFCEGTQLNTEASKDNHYLLWDSKAPGALGSEPSDMPWFSVHLPSKEKNTGTAVVICPGGGYAHLADKKEGECCAEWLNSFGVAAFVLRYRIAPRYHYPAPMLDAKRMMRIVRARSSEWGINPNRIGIWGFSAGGHLASTIATHFDSGDKASNDPIERISCRPDFLILAYAVVTTYPPYYNKESISNLLGEKPDPALVKSLSNEFAVTSDTPPSFIFCTDADKVVPAENSVQFYLALRKCGVPAELHIYKDGNHGVGLAENNPILSNWPAQLKNWFVALGVVKK